MKRVLVWVVVGFGLFVLALEYQSHVRMERYNQRIEEAKEEYNRCVATAIAAGVMNYEAVCKE